MKNDLIFNIGEFIKLGIYIDILYQDLRARGLLLPRYHTENI